MMKQIVSKGLELIVELIKGILWLVLNLMKLALEVVKIFLLLLGSIMKLFLVFVHAGTPGR